MVRKFSSEAASSRVRASTLSNRRTFSIAIAAWSANVVTSSICLSVKGPHLRTRTRSGRRWDALAQHWNAEIRAEIAQPLRLAPSVLRISLYVRDMYHPAFEQRAPGRRTAFGLDWNILDIIHEFAREAVSLGAVE